MIDEILLIEDDDIDVLAFRRAAEGFGWRIAVARSADEAIAQLSVGSGRRPLIVLDLNLPGLDGHGFLARLRADASLASIPVVVLTTSTDRRDITRAYGAQIVGYFAKPLDRGAFRAVVTAIHDYWSLAEPPP